MCCLSNQRMQVRKTGKNNQSFINEGMSKAIGEEAGTTCWTLGNQGSLAPPVPIPLNHLTSTSTHSALSKLPEVEKLVVLLWHTTINISTTLESSSTQRERKF